MGNPFVRTTLTAIAAAILALGTLLAVSVLWEPLRQPWVLAVVGGIVLILGIIAGTLGSYDLATPGGWLLLALDHTWSLPNTLFGAVVGNILYPFFGKPSTSQSAGKEWISYKARGTTGFGVDVLQTLGTVNIGGAGNHERVHLLQARILGPIFLPLVGISYVVLTLFQCVWSLTVGLILRLAKLRDTAWFRAPAKSAVSGFWGWIYFATPMELWAYGTEA
jgi:hypothetical protein